MVEQGRTQLFMMLVQQAGAGSLPISNLTPDQFLNFVRTVESMGTQQGLSPIVVYWSSRNAKRLMPEGPGLRQLQRDAFCISVFSEERSDKGDEFCFLIESQGLCLVVYGYKNEDEPGNVFQCVGSVDPQMVRKAFQTMLPVWQFIDLAETNRLEDARNNVGTPTSAPNFVQICRSEWPVVKPYGEEYDSGEKIPVLAGEMTLPVPGQPTPQASTGTADFKPTSIFLSDQAGSYMDGELLAGGELGPPQPLPTMPSPQDEIGAFIRESQSNKPAKAKRDSKSMRGLREVWTNISQASIDTYPPDAQRIIRDIVGQLRHSSDLSSILQLAIEQLTGVLNADRGLIWQVIGDQLTVTNEHAPNGHTCFVGTNLGAQESTAIVLEFLSRFPDESGAGVIAIPDTMQDAKLHKMSPTLASLIELGEVRARLVAQLRCRGIFSGFLELQQCKGARQWSDEDAAVLQCVAEVLSFVVQQAFDLSRIETDAQEMKLINEISLLFRESKGQRSKDTLARSVKLVAEHMGFIHSQIYLYNEEEFVLVSQITEGEHSTRMELSAKDNPFVSVFESGRGKVINAEYTRKGDPFFQHDTALIVPLISEGERLGVMGLWERHSGSPHFRAQDRELAITIAGNLASIIRADQAIAQLRQDRARERLINRVSQEIRQSLKEVDQILETLVVSLREHLELGLCVVSLYDSHLQDFTKSKTSGEIGAPVEGEQTNMAPNFGEQLFLAMLEELAQGKILIMSADEIKKQLEGKSIEVPGEIKAATLVPLIQGETFKGALCMVSCDRYAPFSVKDMNMITDLADRVAVVIAHKELFEQVERQAVTDPMTGLFNRRFFQEQLSKEIDRHQRFGHPFSYIILDLDYLKKINDGLGHQFGDAAIKHIANVLKKAVRDVDTTARYGGEEFVVLLPETDAAAARIVADRICTMIREKEVDGVGVVTASVGVSTFPHDTTDRDKLTELADQALYLAKHRGRNQVCTVSEHLFPSLKERGEEALEVQKATIKAKADELASIDLKLIAEHGLLGILGAIIKLIEARDAYTNDRSPRAADYAGKLAQALHLSKEHTTIISLAAILHNIGKIAISEDILKKKDALTEEERKIIETSPTIGAKILEPAKHLHRVAAVVEAYHEHWDGSGYPKGLKGEDIPLESRIIALIDAYVAMTSDRPYRNALSNDEAIQIMRTGAGKDWDPRLVKLFLSVLSKENLGPSKSPSA
jgi:diguanylate cyclase (GGDEF)-like protein